jgi:hypothetical protein
VEIGEFTITSSSVSEIVGEVGDKPEDLNNAGVLLAELETKIEFTSTDFIEGETCIFCFNKGKGKLVA